jgi:tetratricopeptide (TPR) repeat protein
MEFIPNARTLAQYADEKKLGTRQRLDLLVKVCDAVQHGHQKGIIHRDLKPSNILVDSDGHVKIIDFGVARSTDSDMAVTSLQTDVGQLVGTLQYMSPEQCLADPNDLDIRSDIYSLGVVFYELLCGKPPYDLRRVTIMEATRVIREDTPARLSTINKTLRGDVETIALKAMEKERARRYQSAAEFGQDIQRYLSGEAITAHRASIVYQLRVFARRNRAAFTAVAAVFIVLVGATVVSTTLYWRAETARKHAEESRAQAEAVTTFLTDTLTSADPAKSQGNDVTVKEVLDKAGEKVGTSFASKPLVEATVRNALGRTYVSLGDFPTASAHLEAGFDRCKQEPGTEAQAVSLLNALGHSEQRMGNFAAAEARYREALRRAELIEGVPGAAAVSGALFHTGSILADQMKLGEAESMMTTAVEMARKLPNQPHPNLGFSLLGLASVKKLKGEYLAAEKLFREAWAIRRQLNGDFHPAVADVIRNLGTTVAEQGKYKAAQELFEQCLAIDRKLHPTGHPDLGATLSKLAATMAVQGQLKEAEPYLREAVELHRKFDPQSMLMAESLAQLGVCLSQRSQVFEAEQYLREAISLWQKLHGDNSDAVARCTDQLGIVLQELGNFEEAEKHFRSGRHSAR